MMKLYVALVSTAASLGFAGLFQDDPKSSEPPAPTPGTVEIQAQEGPAKTITVVLDDEGPSAVLREAYDRLARLRGERLAEQPKALLDRAAQLYRDAIRDYNAAGEANRAKARSTAIAALELARAVERLRDVQRSGRSDPDLPPPPPAPVRAATKVQMPVAPLPPALPAPPAPPVPPVPPVPPTHEVFVFPEGKGEVRVLRKLENLPSRRYDLRKFDVLVPEERAREAAEALRQGHQAIARAYVLQAPLRRGSVNQELRKAYDRIRKAREDFKDKPEARLYLDSARDLYNSARRDAEAGRPERAIELARAAEALTHVPGLLDGPRSGPDEPGDRPEVREERRRVEVRVEGKKKADAQPKERRRVEVRVEGKEQPDEKAPPEAEKPRADEGRRIELRLQRREADRSDDAREGEPDGIEGIGLSLKSEDGKVIVVQAIPGGPADRSGNIKAGDQIVGIVLEDGEKTEFKDKDLPEIVQELRGEAGSRVRLLVLPEGAEGPKVVELTRARLVLPQPEVELDRHEINRDVREALEGVERHLRDALPRRVEPGNEPLPPPLPDSGE